MKVSAQPTWLKNRGYLHVGGKVDIKNWDSAVVRKVMDPAYIARHAFLPLIHSRICERRYKKVGMKEGDKRSHTKIESSGQISKNVKIRPLHYATHLDAIVFGYYADILLKLYEENLSKVEFLSDSVIAYRRIPTGEKGNKSAINFAHEVFTEIKRRSASGPICIVKLDIKSFFSCIDHKILKEQWAKLIGQEKLPPDHYNVFRGATRFSYILKDDLRQDSTNSRLGFNERRLAKIRKNGVLAFFQSPHDLKIAIKNKNVRVCKYPFRNREGFPMGIPQGLPISAVLANIYLYEFDKQIVDELVKPMGGFYRRYSDDIVFICREEELNYVKNFINKSIKSSRVEISEEKTETFIFEPSNGINSELGSYCVVDGKKKAVPFTYLGFEFYGNKTLIKSSNISKFYRRLIYAVKRKCKLAKKICAKDPASPIVIHRNQLYGLYASYPLHRKKIFTKVKWLEKNNNGEFFFRSKKIDKKQRSNYFSYAFRASKIMNEPSILRQLRKHTKILNEAIKNHSKDKNTER